MGIQKADLGWSKSLKNRALAPHDGSWDHDTFHCAPLYIGFGGRWQAEEVAVIISSLLGLLVPMQSNAACEEPPYLPDKHAPLLAVTQAVPFS